MNVTDWIEKELKPRICDSTEFMYNEMESQSAHSLPIIYHPFDMKSRAHWRDRGSLFDYLFSTDGEGKKLLDFGPGDGWPSLIVAPFAGQVIGVDGSKKRVEVCSENAERLKIKNVHFMHVKPKDTLPFDNGEFDGIMAASSIEQTPNPKYILKELYRTLTPGGRLRINYEALSQYQKKKEREVFFESLGEENCVITIYDRYVTQETANMYKCILSRPSAEVLKLLYNGTKEISFDSLSVPVLDKLKQYIIDVRKCVLNHPAGETFIQWMKEIGFSEIYPTHSGSWFAGQLFDVLPKKMRPESIDELDKNLKPIIKTVVRMHAPMDSDPMITAVK